MLLILFHFQLWPTKHIRTKANIAAKRQSISPVGARPSERMIRPNSSILILPSLSRSNRAKHSRISLSSCSESLCACPVPKTSDYLNKAEITTVHQYSQEVRFYVCKAMSQRKRLATPFKLSVASALRVFRPNSISVVSLRVCRWPLGPESETGPGPWQHWQVEGAHLETSVRVWMIMVTAGRPGRRSSSDRNGSSCGSSARQGHWARASRTVPCTE